MGHTPPLPHLGLALYEKRSSSGCGDKPIYIYRLYCYNYAATCGCLNTRTVNL